MPSRIPLSCAVWRPNSALPPMGTVMRRSPRPWPSVLSHMFGQQEGELQYISRAPARRQELWRKLEISPRGIDREIVEIMHRSTMGVDTDYRNILMQGLRASLADGWGGSMIATDLQDVLFRSPQPVRAAVNLGVLKKDAVNIVVHGHEPVLSEMIVAASRDPELLKMAEAQGAKGINIAGICCTANEILMRHGIPVAGNFLQQELAIITGAVDLMVVDVQCIMPVPGQSDQLLPYQTGHNLAQDQNAWR